MIVLDCFSYFISFFAPGVIHPSQLAFSLQGVAQLGSPNQEGQEQRIRKVTVRLKKTFISLLFYFNVLAYQQPIEGKGWPIHD